MRRVFDFIWPTLAEPPRFEDERLAQILADEVREERTHFAGKEDSWVEAVAADYDDEVKRGERAKDDLWKAFALSALPLLGVATTVSQSDKLTAIHALATVYVALQLTGSSMAVLKGLAPKPNHPKAIVGTWTDRAIAIRKAISLNREVANDRISQRKLAAGFTRNALLGVGLLVLATVWPKLPF